MAKQKSFAGVPAGRVQVTPLPNVLFSELLPEIDDLAELQVTLHIYFLLYHKKGSPRFVTLRELQADSTLRRALSQNGQPVEDILARGLGKAEARGTLLHLSNADEHFYFFSTEESRRALDRYEAGESILPARLKRAATVVEERPNIFILYEQNMGVLTPMISEELKEAEQIYPADWILDAFRIANENNKRTWSYVRAILENWTREGKDGTSGRDSQKKREPHFQGKFADIVKRQK